MMLYKYPREADWAELIKRQSINPKELEKTIKSIFDQVSEEGDVALIRLTKEFDTKNISSVVQRTDSVDINKLDRDVLKAIDVAYKNIYSFHSKQKERKEKVETTSGVYCWRESRAIEKVGLYIPGGSAPLFSSLLMLAIPAKIAGCKEVVVCTPPKADGNIHELVLYTAQKLGISNVYKVGGAQAIAAMALGTESIPSVSKIFGPGNQYVTAAKVACAQYGIQIDMPAGPSEVLVIADENADPKFVAADMLSQAEHGPDSQTILLSDSLELLRKVEKEVSEQIEELPRKLIARKALENSRMILLETLQDCMDFSNAYAPEHLIINTANYRELSKSVINAGSVFLGPYSCESAGDYASGTNHTLPTNGFARSYSGVSLDSFIKKITFQEISREGIKALGPSVEVLAEAEELLAHKEAVTVRVKSL